MAKSFRKPASDPTLPSANLWARVTRMLTWFDNFQALPPLFINKEGSSPLIFMNPTATSSGVWVVITGSVSIGTGRWSYAWAEVDPVGGGGYLLKTGGKTSGTTGELAYNSMEAYASGSGIQPEGINQANVDAVPGAAFKPIGVGAVVMLYRVVISGTAERRFTVPRSPDGSCAGA